MYGVDNKGQNKNLSYALNFANLLSGAWTWNGGSTGIWYLDDYYGVLQFNKDGSMLLKKGYLGDRPLEYAGTYEIAIEDGEDSVPGTLKIDLEAVFDAKEKGYPSKITGKFKTEMLYLYDFYLYPLEGDGLFDNLMDLSNIGDEFNFMLTGYDLFED